MSEDFDEPLEDFKEYMQSFPYPQRGTANHYFISPTTQPYEDLMSMRS